MKTEIKVSFRQYQQGERVTAMMPLLRNVPSVDHEDWRLVECPVCGEKCWESGLARWLMSNGATAACTDCALKEMLGTDGRDNKI